MGCAASIVLTTFGASYGTAKSAGAIFATGIIRPERLMQNTYVTPGPKNIPRIWGVRSKRADPWGWWL